MAWEAEEAKRKQAYLARQRRNRQHIYNWNPGKGLLEEVGDAIRDAGYPRDGHYSEGALRFARRAVAGMAASSTEEERGWLEFAQGVLEKQTSWEEHERRRKRRAA